LQQETVPGSKPHQLFALKEMLPQKFKAEGRMKEVFIEKCVLQNLKDPSAIKFYQSFACGGKFYFLLEFCYNGSLAVFLERQRTLGQQLTRHFVAEIVLALEYLRSREIVHRDLKPGNVVLDKHNHLKLIDFATCKVFNQDLNSEICKA
jgi:serine/threonine protein kinase